MFIILYNWELEIVEKSKIEIEAEGNKGEWGNIVYVDKRITLLNSLSYDLKRQTLIHELTHAIQNFMGYGKLSVEQTCDFMAAHLDVIRDIVDYYFREVTNNVD